MRVDTTHEDGVDHPRQRDVVDVAAAAGENARSSGRFNGEPTYGTRGSLARGLRVD